MSVVVIAKKAEKQLVELKGTSYFTQMLTFIELLEYNSFPRGYDIKKIKRDKTIRVRFGKYRLFYNINKKDNRIEIYSITLRKKAYKK